LKNLLKLSFVVIAIAVCFANCTKDNSSQTKPVTTKTTFQNLSIRDTITPGPGKSGLATPSVSRDTITPGPGKGGE